MENEKQVSTTVSQAEDKAFKTAAQFFADELLPYFNVDGKVVSIYPTEFVHLEARRLTQDFNFLMDNGRIAHLEFQSTNLDDDDLRRFREYDAVTSRVHRRKVITYVIFSGKVKEPHTIMDVGLHDYEVIPIVMRDDNADEWIEKIRNTMSKGKVPDVKDLAPLMLTPLMSGESSQMERFSFGFDVLRQVEKVHGSNIKTEKMQAVLYTFANKFLEPRDLNQIKEMISMTVLGEMLVNDGLQKGLEKGLEKGLAQGFEKGISSLIRTCQNLNATRNITKDNIIKEYDLSEPDAEKYMEKYWK